MTGGRARRARLWVLLVLLTLGMIEATSAVFFHLARRRFVWADPGGFTREIPDTLADVFDPDLGWRRRYPTPFGERPRAQDRGRTWVTTCGDSFTHGDEVKDPETWEESLARHAGADVLNFGMSAFGPDQALLYFREKLPAARRGRVAILGAGLENINRIVNVYRPFYVAHTGIPLTKPRFVLEDGRLVLHPNPVRTPAELARLADAGFIDRIGRDDYWYPHAAGPRLRFPYARLLFEPSLWRQVLAGAPAENETSSRDNLWAQPEPRRLFVAIVRAFAEESRAAGLRPVFALMPSAGQVLDARNGRTVPVVALVARFCADLDVPLFNGIEVEARAANRDQKPVGAYFSPGGHLSPLGNEEFGAALDVFLRERDLGPS